MSAVLIKMCGFTTPADVRAGVMAGADLIGLNFCPSSPRAVSLGLAERLVGVAKATRGPGTVSTPIQIVAVFQDPEAELVEDVIAHLHPDLLQFHGNEAPELCERFQYPYLKALRVQSHLAEGEIRRYLGPWSRGYLVDSFHPTLSGGTGVRLRSHLAALAHAFPGGFLAGGLTPENVGAAVLAVRPHGVDVASGIEIRPGVKSEARMVAFVREARRVPPRAD